jgi:hypothetical protein
MSFVGALTALIWVKAGKETLDGKPVSFGAILEDARARWLDVAAPHGGRVTAVTVGIQFILPGIFYALQYAFVDMVAVLDPEKPALRRAGQLSYGMRGRLFRLLLGWTLLTYVIGFAVALPLEGVRDMAGAIEKSQELFLDPSSWHFAAYVTNEVLWAVSTWMSTLSLLWLYVEREDQVRARAELKELKKRSADRPHDAEQTLEHPVPAGR